MFKAEKKLKIISFLLLISKVWLESLQLSKFSEIRMQNQNLKIFLYYFLDLKNFLRLFHQGKVPIL